MKGQAPDYKRLQQGNAFSPGSRMSVEKSNVSLQKPMAIEKTTISTKQPSTFNNVAGINTQD